VGASVLIALAVIVLPMMLGGRSDSSSSETREIEIPPQPSELSFESRRFPVGEDSAGNTTAAPPETDVRSTLPRPKPASNSKQTPVNPVESATTPKMTQSTPSGDVDITPIRTPGESAGSSDSANTDVGRSSPPPDRSATDGRYLVQVASFGSSQNANRLAAKLQEQGYAVLMDSVKSDVGVLNRVRVGPFNSESEAGQSAERIKAAIEGVTPRVLDLQPENVAQVTQPADPYVRWIVQVGSFSNTECRWDTIWPQLFASLHLRFSNLLF
jgi:DedD protein